MNNPVDKRLTERIREVFDDFEDPTADLGWQKLREKYPERRRRPLILWLSSAAALFVLATGLWLLKPSVETTALKPAKEKRTLTKTEKPKSNSRDEELIQKEIVLVPSQSETGLYGTKPSKELPGAQATGKPEDSDIRTGHSEGQRALSAQMKKIDTAQTLADAPLLEVIERTKTASLLIAQHDFRFRPINPKKPVYQDLSDLKPIENNNKDGKSINKNPKLAFSVFAGSYFNYSEGSENQLNFGAGFISDIRLSRNLKLSTGLALASNSLDFNFNEEPNLPQSVSASFDSSIKQVSGSLTTITSYQARLLTLDIPVNIKYQFIPESDRFYISTGLSSGTYLNETYAHQYRNFSTASGSYISQRQAQKTRRQLNDFDLGRTLNLSIGVSRPFGKGQTIGIEPFLKYPLGGLGSEDLKFGSSGINLKLRFNTVKQ